MSQALGSLVEFVAGTRVENLPESVTGEIRREATVSTLSTRSMDEAFTCWMLDFVDAVTHAGDP
ncbi:MAG: hypothetical protein M1132_00845 [Chloroflexi bacterium]|nr:hypothetical protein [Chloroflexota bacterium]